MKEKTYKQIEASRNRRLWLTQVALPVLGTGVSIGTALYMGNPEFREGVNNVMHNAKVWWTEKKDKKSEIHRVK